MDYVLFSQTLFSDKTFLIETISSKSLPPPFFIPRVVESMNPKNPSPPSPPPPPLSIKCRSWTWYFITITPILLVITQTNIPKQVHLIIVLHWSLTNHFISITRTKRELMGLTKHLILALSIAVLSLTSFCSNSLHHDDLHNNIHFQEEYGYDFRHYPSYFRPVEDEFANSVKIGRALSDRLASASAETAYNVINFGAKGDGSTDDTKVSKMIPLQL